MENKYKSKPHEIEAFQFVSKDTKPPEWFLKEVREGRASVTINNKGEYITIYSEDQFEKAYLKDWVCRAGHGKVYVLDNINFQNSFESI